MEEDRVYEVTLRIMVTARDEDLAKELAFEYVHGLEDYEDDPAAALVIEDVELADDD